MKKTVLAIAAFILMSQNCYAQDLSSWAGNDYEKLSSYGIISESVAKKNLSEDITRAEFCEMIMNIYNTSAKVELDEEDTDIFSDTDGEAIISAYKAGIVNGKGNGEFKPYDPITRQEMAVMISRLLNAISEDYAFGMRVPSPFVMNFEDVDMIADWAAADMAAVVSHEIINGTDEGRIAPEDNASREQAIIMLRRAYDRFVLNRSEYVIPRIKSVNEDVLEDGMIFAEWEAVPSAEKYKVIVKYGGRSAGIFEIPAELTYLPYYAFDTESEILSIAVEAVTDDGACVFSAPYEIDYVPPAPVIKEEEKEKPEVLYESLEDKQNRVFPDGVPFQSAEEAAANMTEITIPAWGLKKDGSKYSTEKTLKVNAALADDVIAIFTEIYNDPSQFPIKDVGGYSWRNTAGGNISQHSYGTCIDINANENYYVSPSGVAITGSYWKPGEDPYSIAEDSVVVKTFAKYGWKWGGNAWSEQYNRDYMHFTYLGK